jgi:hypothetical protein
MVAHLPMEHTTLAAVSCSVSSECSYGETSFMPVHRGAERVGCLVLPVRGAG